MALKTAIDYVVDTFRRGILFQGNSLKKSIASIIQKMGHRKHLPLKIMPFPYAICQKEKVSDKVLVLVARY